MNRHFLHKCLGLLCAALLIAATLLTGCQSEPAKQPHDHQEPSVMGVSYAEEANGTLTLTIKDCEGNLLFTKKDLTKKALVDNYTDSVLSLSWVTSNNPGGYESVYLDRLHCRVSGPMVGEQATDGTRLVYSTIKDGVLTVILQDLFDKDAYYQEAPLSDAYLDGDYVVLGAQMATEDQASISYLTSAEGTHRVMTIDLYPDGKPTEETKKTETTKKTEETKKTEKTKKPAKTEAKKTEKTKK